MWLLDTVPFEHPSMWLLNTLQHSVEPTVNNEPCSLNPVFAPNLTGLILHASLISQPHLHNNFQNCTNRVHKVGRSVAPPALNMPNIPPGQKFVPNMSYWRFSRHKPSIVNQDITTAVYCVPPISQAKYCTSTKINLV